VAVSWGSQAGPNRFFFPKIHENQIYNYFWKPSSTRNMLKLRPLDDRVSAWARARTRRVMTLRISLCDSCVDPHRKTMEFHMKNLYECAHFPYLGVQKWGEKKSIKPPFPKGISVRIPAWIPYGAFHALPTEFPYGFHRVHFIVPVGRGLVNNNIF
jgi:hypothetical protein